MHRLDAVTNGSQNLRSFPVLPASPLLTKKTANPGGEQTSPEERERGHMQGASDSCSSSIVPKQVHSRRGRGFFPLSLTFVKTPRSLKTHENEHFHTQPEERSLKMSESSGTWKSCGAGARQGRAAKVLQGFFLLKFLPCTGASQYGTPGRSGGEEERKELQGQGPLAQEGCQGAGPPALEGNSGGRGRKRRSEEEGVA